MVGIVFALLLLAVALVTTNQGVRWLGLAAVVMVAALALPTYLTGEPAEEVVERLPGVSERVIDRHQDAATTAFVAVEVVGDGSRGVSRRSRYSPAAPPGGRRRSPAMAGRWWRCRPKGGSRCCARCAGCSSR